MTTARVLKMENEDKEGITFVNLPSLFPGVVAEPETQDKRHHCMRALDAPLASLPLFLLPLKDSRPLEWRLGRGKKNAVPFR